MSDFSMGLNEDQEQLKKWIHDFAADVMRPAGEEWDEREEFPYPIVQEAANIGLYGWEFMAELNLNDPTGISLVMAIMGTGLAAAGIAASGTPEQVMEGTVALADRVSRSERVRVNRHSAAESASFAGYRFPPEVILQAVRWYLRYGLSYRDVEELLAERGIEVDHVTIYRWVQTFTPLLIDAARPCRHVVGDRWFVDETYVKVNGVWRYVYRAVDQHGQVIDVYVSKKRNITAAQKFFADALSAHGPPAEITTDLAAPLLHVIDQLLPEAVHDTEQYSNNRIENDHGRLKARLKPMRGLRTDRTASIVIRGHAFVQNLRRGHYELGVESRNEQLRLAAAFEELAAVI